MSQKQAEPLETEFDGEFELPASVDKAAVRRMQLVADLLDDSVRVPGTSFRVGIDPILGVVPVGGDAVSAAFSIYIVLESARLGVSFGTLLRMLANVSLDFTIGSVPVVGTVFDAVWKANKRNVKLALDDLAPEPDEVEDPITVPVE